jgi:microcystin-dependent protein
MNPSRTTREHGSITVYGPHIDMKANNVKNIADPVLNQDAATKFYVDRFTHIGDVKMSVYNNDFFGWLKCDGRSLSRTTYAALFAVIGTSFGSVNSSSFNLPDCRGRVLGTLGTGAGLSNRSLGDSVGAETHTLTISEIPSHTHTYLGVVGQGVLGGGTDTAADEANRPTQTSGATGGGGAHNNMQPTMFIGNVFMYSGLE